MVGMTYNITMDKDLRIVYFGTPGFVLPVIKALQNNFELAGIVTTKNPSPTKDYANEQNIPVLDPEKLDEQFIEDLKALNPDLIVVGAYGKIIPQEVLDIPKHGSLNVHPSLLPKYRGASPIQSALLNGDKETGVSIMVMDEKMDHGPVINTSVISISEEDNNLTLSNKLFETAAKQLIKLIPDFVLGKVKGQVQDHDKATFCKLIKKETGYFEIDTPPSNLKNMARAYYPWPTAWTKWNGKIIKFLPDNMIQMEGKKPTKLADFLRGYPDFPVKEV